MAKATVTIKTTTTKIKTRKASSPKTNKSGSKKCPSCGRYM